MRYLVQGILLILLTVYLMFIVFLGIDISVAMKDYERLKENGDYEQKVEGCIFDWVCEKYTKELQK